MDVLISATGCGNVTSSLGEVIRGVSATGCGNVTSSFCEVIGGVSATGCGNATSSLSEVIGSVSATGCGNVTSSFCKVTSGVSATGCGGVTSFCEMIGGVAVVKRSSSKAVSNAVDAIDDASVFRGYEFCFSWVVALVAFNPRFGSFFFSASCSTERSLETASFPKFELVSAARTSSLSSNFLVLRARFSFVTLSVSADRDDWLSDLTDVLLKPPTVVALTGAGEEGVENDFG